MAKNNADSVPPLKKWVQNIFEGVDSNTLLFERASLIAEEATTKCNGDPSKKIKIIPDICSLIFNRYWGESIIHRQGDYTHIEKEAKKIIGAIKKLETAFGSNHGLALRWFSDRYNGAIPLKSSTKQGDFVPDWELFVLGLQHLKHVADRQVPDLKELADKAKQAGRPSSENRINNEITNCYTTACGGFPRISRDPIKGEPSGPFVRFAQFLEDETNPYDVPGISLETIASALKRAK